MAMTAPSSLPRIRPVNGVRALRTMLSGWTFLVFGFLYAPIAVLLVFAFNDSRLNIVWTGFTLRWFGDLVRNGPLVEALGNSLVIASVTTVLSVVIGTVGAWLLHRYRFRFEGPLRTLIAVPMVMPEIVMGISLLIFFTTVLLKLGFVTVIIAHVTFCFPFVLIAVQSRLTGLDPALEEAALDLGATPFRAFCLVILPFLRPAIIAGALMAFTLSMDEVIVTYFTASPGSATLPLRIFGMAKVGLNPMLNALSALFVVATVALVLFSAHLKKSSPAARS